MSFTTVTVTGKYLTPAGAAEVGTVSFTLSAPIMDAAGKVIRSTATATATLDATGAFSLALPANDDTGTTPTGTTYGVVEQLSKNSVRAYSVVIPHTAAAGTVDITALAPVASGTVVYGVTSVNGQTGAVTVSGSSVSLVFRGVGVIAPPPGSYFPPSGERAFGTVSPALGKLLAHPLILGRSITLGELAVKVTAAAGAGGVCRLGIYADDGTFYPGALLLDAGTVATTSIATVAVTTSQVLAAGVYWMVSAAQVAAATFTGGTAGIAYHGMWGDTDANNGYIFAGASGAGSDGSSITQWWVMTGVTAALPGTFSATRTPGNSITQDAPLIVGKAI